jgi:hypothetical protein
VSTVQLEVNDIEEPVNWANSPAGYAFAMPDEFSENSLSYITCKRIKAEFYLYSLCFLNCFIGSVSLFADFEFETMI